MTWLEGPLPWERAPSDAKIQDILHCNEHRENEKDLVRA